MLNSAAYYSDFMKTVVLRRKPNVKSKHSICQLINTHHCLGQTAELGAHLCWEEPVGADQQLIRVPRGRLSVGAFGTSPSGKRPTTHWRNFISHLVWECLGIPQEHLDKRTDGRMDGWTRLYPCSSSVKLGTSLLMRRNKIINVHSWLHWQMN